MTAQEYKITFANGSTKVVKATSLVFYDEDGQPQSLLAAEVRTVIRADVAEREARPRVRHAAI